MLFSFAKIIGVREELRRNSSFLVEPFFEDFSAARVCCIQSTTNLFMSTFRSRTVLS